MIDSDSNVNLVTQIEEFERRRVVRRRRIVAALIGIFFGVLTIRIEIVSVLSSNHFVAAFQSALMLPVLPGMIGAMALVSNVHDFPISVAAILNAIIDFCIALGIMKLIAYFYSKVRAQ